MAVDLTQNFDIRYGFFKDVNTVTDSADSNFTPSILRVGVAGDLTIVNLAGQLVTIKGCAAGEFIRGLATGVRASGTTATGITRYD